MQHRLSLEIPNTLNLCVLRIIDSSIYSEGISVKCPLLQITVPGFTQPQFVDNVTSEFSLNLTACQLKVQSSNCGTVFNSLPDGVYIVKYSISPNEYVYVEYNHLRISKALVKIKGLYCDLDMGACDPPVKIKDRLRELREIQDFLFAAQSKVDTCREVKKGRELYAYAMSRLDKMICKSC